MTCAGAILHILCTFVINVRYHKCWGTFYERKMTLYIAQPWFLPKAWRYCHCIELGVKIDTSLHSEY